MIKPFIISIVVAFLYRLSPDTTICLALASFFIGLLINGLSGAFDRIGKPTGGQAVVQSFANGLMMFGCLGWVPFIGSVFISVGGIVLNPEHAADSDAESGLGVSKLIANLQVGLLGLLVLWHFSKWVIKSTQLAHAMTWFRKGSVQQPNLRFAPGLLGSPEAELREPGTKTSSTSPHRRNLILAISGLLVFGGSMILLGNLWDVPGFFPCRSWYAVLWQWLASVTLLSGSWLARTMNDYHLEQGGKQDEEVLSRMTFFLGLAGLCLLINLVYTVCWKVPIYGWPR